MSRLSNLKNAEEIYRKVSVRDDYTIEEREQIREWAKKADRKNKDENTDAWKVRGTPKKRPPLGENNQAEIKDNLNMNHNERGNVNLTNTSNRISKNIIIFSKIRKERIRPDIGVGGEIKINQKFTEIQSFETWNFGTINIRSGKEKEDGAKIYRVAKEANRAGLLFCGLQEVRYRNSGSKLIKLDTGESFESHWCGQKRRREAGVGILVRENRFIEISSPAVNDVNDPRIMAINLKIHGFNVRIVNGYSQTKTGGSDNQKDLFYRSLKTACVKTHKHQKLIVVGDFNATTNVATYKSCYDGVKSASSKM